MILASGKVSKSTSGMKIRGAASDWWTRNFISLSISMDSGREQQAHSVLISTVNDWFRNRPCTKGVANASTAQAA